MLLPLHLQHTYCTVNLGSSSTTIMASLLWASSRQWLAPALEKPSSFWLFTPLRYKNAPKTVSGVKKRFRLRGSGSIKRYVCVSRSCRTILCAIFSYLKQQTCGIFSQYRLQTPTTRQSSRKFDRDSRIQTGTTHS